MMQKFFQLLRYSIGASDEVPDITSEEEWNDIYEMAAMQSISAVLFYGVQKGDMRPPFQLLMDWVAAAGQIEEQNRTVNRVAVKFLAQLRQDGFEGCILKGQGNNLLYPNVYSRMSGDVDVWVRKVERNEELGMRNEELGVRNEELGVRNEELGVRNEGLGVRNEGEESLEFLGEPSVLKIRLRVESIEENVREVIRYVKERNPKARAVYHHIDYGEFDEVEVEMHYRPSFMNNLIHNGRMQKWFEEVADEQFSHEVELPDEVGKVCVPTNAFNRIYQMSHLSRHLFHEGIGLRQILDYFFLLKGEKNNQFRVERVEELGVRNEELGVRNEELGMTLKRLGLWKIAMAVMWVLHEVLGLEEEYLIAPMDERLGRVLLSEIMRGGNFGQYDEQNIKADNALKKNWQRICRDFRMMRYFPSECLWEPVFRIWHFFWRIFRG